MNVFMKRRRTIGQLMGGLPGQRETPPNFSVLRAKIGEDTQHCTLEQLNKLIDVDFVQKYVPLSEVVFCLIALEDSN